MSDNRAQMSDNRAHEWLNDATAKRLLRGDHDDPRAEALQRLLSAAAVPAAVDALREEMAVAAFRAARDEGRTAETSPLRRIVDDWRRRGGALPTGRSVRALAGALMATAALGGVAVAAATGALPGVFGPFGGRTSAGQAVTTRSPTPQATSSQLEHDSPAGGAARGVPTPTGPSTPAAGDSPKSLCRSWVVAARRDQAMDARAYQRLVSDAGGRRKVPGYCAGVLGWGGKNAPGSGATGKQRGDADSGRDSQRSSGDAKASGSGDRGDDASDGKSKADRRAPGRDHGHGHAHGNGRGGGTGEAGSEGDGKHAGYTREPGRPGTPDRSTGAQEHRETGLTAGGVDGVRHFGAA